MSVLAWRHFACSLLFFASCARLHADAFRPHDWERQTNDVFDVVVTGLDDLHLAYADAQRPSLALKNLTDRPLALRGQACLVGFGADEELLPVDVYLAAHATAALPFRRLMSKGIWRFSARCETGRGELGCETKFAIVRRRSVTPVRPEGTFRIGFNYHMERYTDAENEKCLRAMVQAGAKLARVGMGLAFNQVEPEEGKFIWEKTDRRLELLERHGLAVDAILDGTPPWARDERHKDISWSTYGAASVPARPGLFREYCRRCAVRYGTRIAWYEMGNEWDFIKPEVLTVEEALGIQREGYDGVKAGCPRARVLTNGWALPHSHCGHPDWVHVGLQEHLMTEGKGFYDAHPVHLHGPYQEYRKRIDQFMTWRRGAGIADRPWFSNETSLSCAAAGEDRTAACVWQKILFAWTHGSIDYVWYNLRSIGLAALDSEGGYGVITGDFYPRTQFPAFAGLTSLFDGLKPTGAVHEGATREMYGFEGLRDGKRVVVFAAWDDRRDATARVRISTDAARVFAVDLFDNRRPLEIGDGVVAFEFGQVPAAVLLEDVSRATVNAEDVVKGEGLDGVVEVDLAGGRYEFVLDDFDSVHESFKADPRHLDRVWWGKGDCSGTVTLTRKDDLLVISARTKDEKQASDDRLVVLVNGQRTSVSARLVKRGAAICEPSILAFEAQIGFPSTKDILEIRIEDDDGQGVDGWLTTRCFRIGESGAECCGCPHRTASSGHATGWRARRKAERLCP